MENRIKLRGSTLFCVILALYCGGLCNFLVVMRGFSPLHGLCKWAEPHHAVTEPASCSNYGYNHSQQRNQTADMLRLRYPFIYLQPMLCKNVR